MVLCRPVTAADLAEITDLLHEGFPTRSRRYWIQGLDRLAEHRPPAGFPGFGYMLVSEGIPVGVLLTITSTFDLASKNCIRCNVSSWYVRPAFSSYASLLSIRATKDPAVSYVNISPAPNTVSIIEALGFTRFSIGVFAAAPSFRRRHSVKSLAWLPEQWAAVESMPDYNFRLLVDHHRFGCIGLWCETSEGGCCFIFRRRFVGKAKLPSAQLIYAPSLDDLTQHFGPVSRFLTRLGMPITLICTDRFPAGLTGHHFPDKLPLYVKGPLRPRSVDLSYTEAAILGY